MSNPKAYSIDVYLSNIRIEIQFSCTCLNMSVCSNQTARSFSFSTLWTYKKVYFTFNKEKIFSLDFETFAANKYCLSYVAEPLQWNVHLFVYLQQCIFEPYVCDSRDFGFDIFGLFPNVLLAHRQLFKSFLTRFLSHLLQWNLCLYFWYQKSVTDFEEDISENEIKVTCNF